MRLATFVVASLLALTVLAAGSEGNEPELSDEELFTSLNIMAVPVGDTGMILKDSRECLWVVRNEGEILNLVALAGDETGDQLCGAEPE